MCTGTLPHAKLALPKHKTSSPGGSMRLQCDTGRILFHAEAADTVDRIATLIDLLSGPDCTERVSDDDFAYAIHVQPVDDRLPFLVVVPKGADIDDTLLALCAAYLHQQASPD